MQRRLAWKQHLRAAVAGDRVFLVGEADTFLLRGAPYVALAPLLDGTRSISALMQLAGAEAPAWYFALQHLERRGYVAAVAPDGAGWWQALRSDAAVVAARLAATAVAIAEPLVREAALAAGLRVDDAADAAGAVQVIAVGDYLDPIEPPAGRWMPVRLDGLTPWIGPLFGADGAACWTCLQHRVRWNRPVETWLARRGTEVAAPLPSTDASRRLAADHAALVLAWWIADGGVGAIDHHLIALSLTELQATQHRVVRRPQCPRCGDPTPRGAAIALASRPRARDHDGGYRTVGPDATVARLAPQVSPVTGVVASIGPVAGRDHPLRPVAGAVYRVTPADDDAGFDDFHRMSSGKGCTAIQAHASALGEALERISALWHGDEVAVRAPFAADCVHPDALQLFSERQRATRDPDERGKHRVPPPCPAAPALAWTPAWSLTHARAVRLPTAYCYQHAPFADDAALCVFNPNGHAAGNCLEEAILQGFLELVERDAIAIWWYARLRVPGVDLDGFDDGYFVALRDHYATLGYAVRVLDVTTELGIPTFVAIADGPRHAIGFGCHLDARLAVQRALTELNQIFTPDLTVAAPWDPRALADDGFLRADLAIAPRTAADYPLHASAGADLRDDVLACVARAAAAGLEVIVLDQTRPDLGLSAAKVVVPGLRHFWPRFGPGRLYDVPARRGRAVTEADLNPVPLLL